MELIERRIVHILTIYPIISPSMLQTSLGPKTRAAEWKPVLERLIDQGIVKRESHFCERTPTERQNSYTKLSLNGVEHPDISI